LNFFTDDPIDLPESIGQQKATLTEGECRELLVLQREMTASTRTLISTNADNLVINGGPVFRDYAATFPSSASEIIRI
jgi:hypothetical protein